MDRGYQLVIGAKFDGINYTYLHLDTCMEKRITSSAQIPTQPLQDGNTISDHMYRNPDEYTISGSFSLHGAYAGSTEYDEIPDIGNQGDRLSNIQEVFEYIKDNGILCDLTTIDESISGSKRFKERRSMALQNISWTERQASMSYSFTFREVISVEIQDYEIEIDEDLPNIYLPSPKSLGQVMTEEGSEGEVSPYAKIIIQSLLENGYIKNGVGRFLATLGTNLVGAAIGYLQVMLVAAIGAIAVAAIVTGVVTGLVTTGILTASAAATAIFPVGTIIGVAVGALVGGFCLVRKLVKKNKEKQKQKKMFNLVNNIDKYIDKNGNLDEKGALADPSVNINIDELNRLQDFLNKVKDEILTAIGNCNFYAISSGQTDNDNREVVLNIGNTPYYISFIKDANATYGWRASVKTPGPAGEVSLDGTNGTLYNEFLPCDSLDAMDVNTTCMFRDTTRKYEVYLYNPSLNDEINDQDGADNAKKYLCGYQLVVSYGHIQDNISKIYEIINNAIIKGGYV